jgi:hypothetical protein
MLNSTSMPSVPTGPRPRKGQGQLDIAQQKTRTCGVPCQWGRCWACLLKPGRGFLGSLRGPKRVSGLRWYRNCVTPQVRLVVEERLLAVGAMATLLSRHSL